MSNRGEEKRRGQHAEQLLKDELLIEAFSKIREELLKAWEASPARDIEGRETIFLSLKMLERVKAYMQEIVETGRLARTSEEG